MPNPTRDEIKRLAQLVESAYETAAELGKKEVDCSVLSIKQAATLARAYLALREQVDTVALPALKRIEPIIDVLELFSPGGAEDGSIARQTRAAIKAIEEGQG